MIHRHSFYASEGIKVTSQDNLQVRGSENK
jgi:hypothetical protein